MGYGIAVSVGNLPGLEGVERLLALATGDAEGLYPNQIAALRRLAQGAQEKWKSYASGNEPLPDGTRLRPWSGAYLQSILLEEVNALDYRVFSDPAIAPHAPALEWGAKGWDMRELLRRSHRARRSAEGKLYLIIPYRHGTPQSVVVGAYSGREMPQDVYALARELAPSLVTGHYEEASVHDAKVRVRRNAYAWGDRLTLRELRALGVEERQAQRMAGMVRFDASTPAARSSLYLTFRTLSEKSPAGTWVIPDRPGKGVAEAVYRWAQNLAPQVLAKAKEFDIERIKRLAGIGGA
ncbi:hypothetical protein [Calidithermus chliarophilus]|uniref:hypothetical protein n=1 Tax=Calidithermus chliarophilus TaxID=52023 RepID=UPI0004113AB8|nr:hypothetical protein [Calidithermus chliarophilus]